MIEFRFEIAHLNDVVIIKLFGSLIESQHGASMLASVESLIKEGKSKFVLNMKDFIYMNSSGLSVIINLLTKARNSNGDVVICEISEKNNDILVITKLNSIFTVCDTVEDALNILN